MKHKLLTLFFAATPALCHADVFVYGGAQYNAADIESKFKTDPTPLALCQSLQCIYSSLTATGISDRDADTGLLLGVGLSFAQRFTAELSWQDFGDFNAEETINVPMLASVSANKHQDNSLRALSASMTMSADVFPSLQLFVRAGVDCWEIDSSLSQRGDGISFDSIKDSDSGVSPYAGLGIRYQVTPKLATALEYQQHKFDANFDFGTNIGETEVKIDLSTTQLWLQYRI